MLIRLVRASILRKCRPAHHRAVLLSDLRPSPPRFSIISTVNGSRPSCTICSTFIPESAKNFVRYLRIVTFEACSGFTYVTACWIAQPPKATFVTRLQLAVRLPDRAARQLPDQSTTCRALSNACHTPQRLVGTPRQ